MRLLALVLLASSFAPTVLAQEARPYALPFASSGHAIELALDLPKGTAPDELAVHVAEAPVWLVFAERTADAVVADDASPTARLAFDVAPDAPVGEAAEIVLAVRDGSGMVRAERRIAVEVRAPAELAIELPRPNPARGPVVLPLLLPEDATVHIAVYDVLGREAIVLADGDLSAGRHTFRLGADTLAPGTYVVRVLTKGPVPDARVRTLTVVR